MFDRIEETPGFWLIAAMSLATFGVEIVILVISRVRLARQKRAQRRAEGGDWHAVAALKTPSRLPEIIGAVLPLAIAATSAVLIHRSRNLLVSAMGQVDPIQKAILASRALNEDLNATAMGLWVVPLVALVGGVAVALAISARRRAIGLRRAEALSARGDNASAWLKFPGPRASVLVAGIGAFLVLGFGPIARAGFAAIATTISHFAATAGLEPPQKGPIFIEGLDRASGLLDQGFLVARVGVAVAALIALYLAWRFSPARARASVPAAPDPCTARVSSARSSLSASSHWRSWDTWPHTGNAKPTIAESSLPLSSIGDRCSRGRSCGAAPDRGVRANRHDPALEPLSRLRATRMGGGGDRR